MTPDSSEQDPWPVLLPDYVLTTNMPETDSEYLRRVGLKPMMLELLGDCQNDVVLDVGCGDGWLLSSLRCRDGLECDVADPDDLADRPRFRRGDVRALPFEDGTFDVVVACLVLMWFAELDCAYAELLRVTRPGGRLLVSIVHPSFYRTGCADDGDFRLTVRLDLRRVITDLKIGGRVGPFVYHQRPYIDYINNALGTGWRLRELRDWYIDIEDYNRRVDVATQHIARTPLVPLYSFLLFDRAH